MTGLATLARRTALATALAWLAPGCGSEEPGPGRAQPERKVPDAGSDPGSSAAADVIDGVLVLGIPGVDLAGLPLPERDRLETFRGAAAAADDVHWDLAGPGRIEVRDTLEQVLASPGDAPPAITARIREFAARAFLWQGMIDPRSGRRLVPRFIPGELAAAAEAASLAGANLPLPDLPDPAATRTERIEALLARIRPALFEGDPREPEQRDASAGTEPELPAVAGPRFERLRGLLEAAGARVVSTPTSTGVRDAGPNLAVVLGPRAGGDGPGVGFLVAVVDRGSAAFVETIASEGAAARRIVGETGGGKVPAGRYPPRPLVPVAVADATGAYGPVLDLGLFPLLDGPLIPDGDDGRVLLAVNLGGALDGAGPIQGLIRASSPDEETADRRLEHRACARLARHALAAVAGSGTDGTERRPPGFLANRLGPAAPVMEHLRELLSVLLLAGAPGIAESLPGGAGCRRAVLDEFAASAVEHLLDTPGGREAPPAVARRIALGRLLERQGLTVVEREGRAVLSVADEDRLREAVAGLLGEVRRIRYDGDGAAARALIDRHGAIPGPWTAAAAALTAAAGGISGAAFVYPPAGAGAPPAGIVESRIGRARRRALGRDVF